MKVNELLTEKTIAHYDEASRTKLTVSKMIAKLNDSSIPQADTDAITKRAKTEQWHSGKKLTKTEVKVLIGSLKKQTQQEILDILEL